jgi:hypothetical protein
MLVEENETIEVVFTSILHVPGLANNLFSITKAISLGHVFEFGKNKCVVKNNKKKVIGIIVEKTTCISYIARLS